MTFQELRGKILFWVVLFLIVGALLSGNLSGAVYLVGILIIGVIAYQVIGWVFYGLSGGNLDPFNVKGEGMSPSGQRDLETDEFESESKNSSFKAESKDSNEDVVGWYNETESKFYCSNCFEEMEGVSKEKFQPINDNENIYVCDKCEEVFD